MLSYSAYVAEVFRAGIESVHPSQRLAGRSLGLTYGQTLRHVVLPQAWRRVIPPLMNDLVSLQKDSGLIAVLGVVRRDPRGADRDGASTSTTRRTSSPACCSAASPSRWRGSPTATPARRATTGQEATCEHPSHGTELLRLDGVRKSFGDHVVLRDVDLTIEPGQCVVLIGASGSGKSTLLRCVNLLEVVDDGVITFEGRDITDPRVDGDEVRSRMGMVFQAYNLFPHLDVMGNVTLALRLVHGVGAEEARSRGLAMLERVGLAEKADGPPRRPVRRAAAAGGDRAGAGGQPAADAARRGDERARPGARR